MLFNLWFLLMFVLLVSVMTDDEVILDAFFNEGERDLIREQTTGENRFNIRNKRQSGLLIYIN